MHHLPNLLSIARVGLAPLCVMAIMRGQYGQAFVLFGIAGLTDYADGFLARRMRWNSDLGAYLDPLADKLLMAAVYIALGIDGAVPWWLVGLIFGRDVFILAGVALLYGRVKQRKFPPSLAGKISTLVQILAVIGVLFVRAGWAPAVVGSLGIAATAAGTVVSGLDYVRRAWRMMRTGEEPEAA